ncbi:DNA binding protein [Yersinia pseudotuberculosis]|uniref:DNA binding protein n=1 Tax=Yersinia pseudotuberculosis serotype O:1b (strain IP 31758) TaxID=349747 RepID=A0A0U1R081_YERP3|nr:DNA binding protein [Yersinia pseudotuberculosis IP 31758]RYC23618.1 XRE family transcriptional regulator [Yersinia pseudotuberculosis]CNF41991.1 DNA binding protein [Yersinia similis]UFA63421.1 XRE family transcriptional regulator [Yersinia pseudotuberculosis]CNG39483.1 DNA binding protein [Yersinia pseudotuberculosis]
MNPERLKSARKTAKLSQEKLGVMAGIDEATARSRVSQYEKGFHTPSFELVKKFAMILNVPECYFYIVDDVFAAAVLQMYHTHQVPFLQHPDYEKLKQAEKLVDQLQKLIVELTNNSLR